MTQHIFVLQPYKINGRGNWVFDDPTKNIVVEPFVMGINEIIDRMLKQAGIKYADAVKGFQLFFSEYPFVGATTTLDFSHMESEGCWYKCTSFDMIGWLCPVLFQYFQNPPKKLYAMVSET